MIPTPCFHIFHHFSSNLLQRMQCSCSSNLFNKTAQNLPRRNVAREYIKRTSKRTFASKHFLQTVQKFIPRTSNAFARATLRPPYASNLPPGLGGRPTRPRAAFRGEGSEIQAARAQQFYRSFAKMKRFRKNFSI